MRTDEDFAKKVNLYLSQDKNPPAPYHGETEVLHYLELVTRGSGFEKNTCCGQKPLKRKTCCGILRLHAAAPGKSH